MKVEKIVIMTALLMGSLANAQTVTCKAQLVHTMCGSGKIELIFDDKTKLFEFQNGDVRCWMGEYRAEGSLEKKPPKYPFFLEGTYQLSTLDDHTKQPVNFGHLVYDSQLKVARLEEVNPRYKRERTDSQYDMSCE